MRKFLMVVAVMLFAGCGSDSQSGDEEWVFCEGEPECPQRYTQLPDGADCLSGSCEEVTQCGESILCQVPEDCDAVPSCPVGSVQVMDESECEYESCQPRSMCGHTIQCKVSVSCAGMPVCPDGATEIADQSECPADTACYEVYDEECGATIWCWEGVSACEIWPPECPQGTNQVAQQSDCPQGDVHCFDVYDETCDQTIWCWEEEELCLAMPACPEGTSEVDSCPDEDQYACEEVRICGVTIYCVDYQP